MSVRVSLHARSPASSRRTWRCGCWRAGDFPKHCTICESRKRHLKDFKALFVQLVRIARTAGVVSLGTLAVAGTKMRTEASKHKAMSYKRMQQKARCLREEIAEMCDRADRVDETEDRRYGADS